MAHVAEHVPVREAHTDSWGHFCCAHAPSEECRAWLHPPVRRYALDRETVFQLGVTLREAARHAAVEFLRIELRVANTMLDVATCSSDWRGGERRRAAARAACGEVARHLAKGSTIVLSASERDELTAGLDKLAHRFVAAG